MTCLETDECEICRGDYGRFRCKNVVIVSGVTTPNQTFKFQVEGMGSTLYEAKWGLPDVCVYGAPELTIPENTSTSIFLSESYMDNASPRITWASEIKHPGSCPMEDYERVRLMVDRAMLSFVFTAEKSPIVHTVELDREVQLRADPRFGAQGKISLPQDKMNKLAAKYPGSDPARLLQGDIRILDIRLAVRLHGRGGPPAWLNLFDPKHVWWKPRSKLITSGSEVELHLHSDYHRKLRARMGWDIASAKAVAQQVLASQAHVESAGGGYGAGGLESVSTDDRALMHRQALILIARGLRMLAAPDFDPTAVDETGTHTVD